MTNDNIPAGGKILDFASKRSQTPGVVENNKTETVPEAPPEGKDFDFNLRDGTVWQGKGFLLATTAFVGLGSGDGQIEFIVPLDQLHYAEAVKTVASE